MLNEDRLIGVLGGVGPWATEEFLRLVLEETEAGCDQEHANLLVLDHAAIPDRTAYILGRSRENPGAVMAEDAKLLERAGCDAIVIPCNTSHEFYDHIAAGVRIPVLHLIREVALEGRHRGMGKLGILCTEGTRVTDLYGRACREAGLACAYPSERAQGTVSHIIYDCVKAGKPAARDDMTAVFGELLDAGCDGLVLGCTELPIAYRALGLAEEYPMALDSLRILARRTVEQAGKRLKEPEAETPAGER